MIRRMGSGGNVIVSGDVLCGVPRLLYRQQIGTERDTYGFNFRAGDAQCEIDFNAKVQSGAKGLEFRVSETSNRSCPME